MKSRGYSNKNSDCKCQGFNHALNLAVLDTLTQIPLFKDSVSFSEELLILLKKSSKRAALLKKLKIAKGKKTRGVKSFAKTRWTVKGDSFDTIIINYTEILETLQESLQEETKTDMKSRINGVMHQMTRFNFFYGICLAREILFVTDTLAKSLQTKNLSAVEGKEMYQITAITLEKMKNVANWPEKIRSSTAQPRCASGLAKNCGSKPHIIEFGKYLQFPRPRQGAARRQIPLRARVFQPLPKPHPAGWTRR